MNKLFILAVGLVVIGVLVGMGVLEAAPPANTVSGHVRTTCAGHAAIPGAQIVLYDRIAHVGLWGGDTDANGYYQSAPINPQPGLDRYAVTADGSAVGYGIAIQIFGWVSGTYVLIDFYLAPMAGCPPGSPPDVPPGPAPGPGTPTPPSTEPPPENPPPAPSAIDPAYIFLAVALIGGGLVIILVRR